jgi:hypothetical protein
MGDLGMGTMTTTRQPRPHAGMQRPRPPPPGETLVPRGFEQVGCVTILCPSSPQSPLPSRPPTPPLPMSMVMHSPPFHSQLISFHPSLPSPR